MGNFLIIGGSTGIGQALVESLAKEGHQIFATYNNHPQEDTENVTFLKYDVINDNLDVNVIPEKLDGLTYCPGSINLKPFSSFSSQDFIKDYQINVVGATTIIRKFLPHLKRSDQGSIVLFSTVAVQSGFNFHSLVSSSKGAIEGLTRALSAELAPKIRVNAIAPSVTDTPLAGKLLSNDQRREMLADQNPMKRVATAYDIAQAAHYLLKTESSYVTGQIIHVDGGMSIIKN